MRNTIADLIIPIYQISRIIHQKDDKNKNSYDVVYLIISYSRLWHLRRFARFKNSFFASTIKVSYTNAVKELIGRMG